jgi:hypothetical protein
MANDIDVFQLLKTFSTKNKLTTIAYPVFAQAIQRQARTYDQTIPLYRDLSLHPDAILIPKLFRLQQDRRLALVATGNRIDSIILPEAFTETVYAEYRRIEENPDIPFPDETSLKLVIPSEWIQIVSVETDLPALVEFEGTRPVLFYRLLFPEGLKSMLVLSASVGDKLLEYAVLKIRNYLRKGSNRDYIQQRLLPAFAGKESLLKDALTTVLIKPFDAVEEMRQGRNDFVYTFWAYLSSAVRKDLGGKSDPTPDDVCTQQSLFIMDVYNTLYRSRAQRGQERETAFNNLGTLLRKIPYLYTMQEICDFRDTQGRPLLGKYTREELEAWIHERSTKADEGVLPEILLINIGHGRTALIAKDRFLPYLLKLMREARVTIKADLTRDWRALLYDFERVDAMIDDHSFRVELSKRIATASPLLATALAMNLAPIVYEEHKGLRETPAELEPCFGNGRTADPDVLLDLDRKRLLIDVRMLLPLWYTIPVLSWIIALFKRGAARKAKEKQSLRVVATADESNTPARQGPNNRALEFSEAARKAERRLVPQGYNLEEYLQTLVGRWNNLLDPVAKANLTEDINSLVRDYLRGVLRTMKPSGFTADRLEMMSSNLADTPNLLKIRNHKALQEYIKLYMIKMLKR